MHTIKQVANILDITPQAIYKRKEELTQKGYLIKDSLGQWQVTDEGYNYLLDTQKGYIQEHNKEAEKMSKENIQQIKEIDTTTSNNNYATLYIKELQDSKNYLQQKLDKLQNSYDELVKANIELQKQLQGYLATHSLPAPTEQQQNQEQTPHQEKQEHKGFFARFFNK